MKKKRKKMSKRDCFFFPVYESHLVPLPSLLTLKRGGSVRDNDNHNSND